MTEFKPEYAGKMNFYLSAVDDLLRHPTDGPTLGLILCKSKRRLTVEYALRDLSKPLGVSSFQLAEALPKELEAALPSVEQLEAELRSDNLTTIKRRASPKDVKRSIVEALHRSAQEDAYKIAVEVVGDKTILTGTTHTWAAREEAEEAAWSAPGITHVDNRIVVNPKLMVH